jgi:prepilin-type N-terminal cleavage/methylation domain-containing protein
MHYRSTGFTLIELSIVLVIVGLLTGGVLAGRQLIEAAQQRAEISQLESYVLAVNTFYNKYQALPGDMDADKADDVGLYAGTGAIGEGDGDGLIEGERHTQPRYRTNVAAGETAVFWRHLYEAKLIAGKFDGADYTTMASCGFGPDRSQLNCDDARPQFMPKAKLGNDNWVFVFGGGLGDMISSDGHNYLSIAALEFYYNLGAGPYARPAITTLQAFNIDTKIDDGLPQSGKVRPYMPWGYGDVYWAAGGATGAAGTGPTQGTATTCYDNDNQNGRRQHYSTEMDGGMDTNCTVALQMQ